MTVTLRPGTVEDGRAAMEVLRRSITELCHADHGGDPAVLGPWLANKTEANWRNWIAVPGATLLVAEQEGRIVGVGIMSVAGTVQVNYVSPEARFQGVSSALLAALEDVARRQGLMRVTLESTVTAHRFYLSRGYRPELPGGTMLVKDL